MKYYIIAGEASGDLHASNLMREITLIDTEATFRAWGGDLMQQAGAELVKHINDLAFMGFAEVALNLRTILGNISYCKNDILQFKPDVVVFVDYPGFNLRIARFCKQNHIPTVYYISPQVWAWHKSRIKAIRRDVDKMMVILPFEKPFYDGQGYDVDFVGHPLLDALERREDNETAESFRQKNNLDERPVIALLPGSRKQEISRMLGPMVKMAGLFEEYQFVIAGTRAHHITFYQKFMGGMDLPVLVGQTYPLLQHSHAALVTSGTATLETALIGTPQVVCYKAGTVSYLIARQLVDLKYISLVNLIMDKKVVTELIQGDFNLIKIKDELQKIVFDKGVRQQMNDDYRMLREKLGGGGASRKAAEIVTEFIGLKK